LPKKNLLLFKEQPLAWLFFFVLNFTLRIEEKEVAYQVPGVRSPGTFYIMPSRFYF
jgi:hypothetical protein